MKLNTKIQLFSSLFVLILIVFVNTAIYFLFYKVSANSELEQLTTQTDNIVEALNESEDISEEELLKAFLPSEGMIRVIGKDSEPVISTLTKKNEYRQLDAVYTTSESRNIENYDTGEKVAVISKPIIWNNGEIVTLQVSQHLIALEKNMRILFYVLLVASIVMLIPIFMGANLLSRFVLQPIKALTQAMKENMVQGEWQKIVDLNQSKDELYEMEATFNEMIDHLKDNFYRQEEFVSNASHELKTPISIIKSYAQMLSRRGTDDPDIVEESLTAIESEAERMQKLVEQMLTLAKNKSKQTVDKIDFRALCVEIVKRFRGTTGRKITFHSVEAPVFVLGNSDHLQQIIYILLENALKYSEQSIDIALGETEDGLRLTVTDYGTGIPQAEQERIFERFYRIDKARSRETGGSGLGLPIARALANAHHGHLFVESEPNQSTTFTLELPQAREQE